MLKEEDIVVKSFFVWFYYFARSTLAHRLRQLRKNVKYRTRRFPEEANWRFRNSPSRLPSEGSDVVFK